MLQSVRPLSLLATVLCLSGPLAVADEPLPREAVAKVAKVSTALVETKAASGTSFCVHSSGLFVTNEHVVRQSAESVTLVLDAGLKTQRVLKAKVLRRDSGLDLALLKVEGDGKFVALELGSDEDLGELTEVIACGFPFGAALAKSGEYPAISINVGSVTSLRREKGGELTLIQLDAALNPGNSGGPVLDRKGKVVGVVVSGIRGSGVNQAIPVSHVHRFLARPELLVQLPGVKAANRHGEFEFTAKAISVLPTKKATELELVLCDSSGKERRFPMKLADGTYRASTVPFPAGEGPQLFRTTLKYENGSVSGTTEDRGFRIGDKEFKLSQLRHVRLGTKPMTLLRDGKKLEGKVTGLEALPLRVGNQTLRVDSTGALEMTVEVPEEVTVLACTVLARQDGQEVGRSSVSLYIDGVSQPYSPSDWTTNLSRITIPDAPLSGKVMGADFVVKTAQLTIFGPQSVLTLRNGQDHVNIDFLNFKPGKDVYEFTAEDQPNKGRPHVGAYIMTVQPPRSATHTKGYVMRLEFGKEKDGKVPCKLYLSLPDDTKSCISGSFTLDSP